MLPEQTRAIAEYLGGTKVRLTWPCGAKRTKDYSKGKVSQRMGEFGCRFISRYWDGSGGIHAPCPKHGKWADSCFPNNNNTTTTKETKDE